MSGTEGFVWTRRYEWHDEIIGMHVAMHDDETGELAIRPGICPEVTDDWDALTTAVKSADWGRVRALVSAIPESDAVPRLPARGLSDAIRMLDPRDCEKAGVSWRFWHAGGIRGQHTPPDSVVPAPDRTDARDVMSVGWRFTKPGWEPADGLALEEVRLAYRFALDELHRVRGDGWANTRTAAIDARLYELSEWRRETEGLDMAGFPWCVVVRHGETAWALHSLYRSEAVARLAAECGNVWRNAPVAYVAPVIGAEPIGDAAPDDIGVIVLESQGPSPENDRQVAPWRVDAITQRHLTGLRSVRDIRDVVDGYSEYPGNDTMGERLMGGEETMQSAWSSVAAHFGSYQTHMRYRSVLRFARDGEDEPTDEYRMFPYTADQLDDGEYESMFAKGGQGPFGRDFLKDMANRRSTLSEVGDRGRMEVCFEEAVSFFGLPVRERVVMLRRFPMTLSPCRISWSKATDEVCG